MIACKNTGYKLLILSATAATNPLEMKALGYGVNLHNASNFKKWTSTVGADVDLRTESGMSIDLKSKRVQLGMMAIHNNLFHLQNISVRLTRLEMKSVFPDNRVMAETFDMGSNTAKIQSVYDHMEMELAILDEKCGNYRVHKFAEIMKARRLAELLKVPTMVDMIDDMYDEGISPVVFVNFQDTMDALIKRLESITDADGELKYTNLIGLIVGGQSAKQRQQHIDDFQSDVRRIMLVNVQAGNAGISLHDLNGRFPRGALLSPSYSAINLIQCLGRCHRAEGKTPVIQKILFAAGTIEERICESVKSKLDNLDLLNDGDLMGGIDW
jgi:SNF2 family DNA or RNA helicase